MKLEGNWAELTFEKTSWTVIGHKGKNWPIADQHTPVTILVVRGVTIHIPWNSIWVQLLPFNFDYFDLIM